MGRTGTHVPHKTRAAAGCQCEGCQACRANDRAYRASRRAARPPVERGLPEVDPSEWEHLRVGYGVKKRTP